MVPLPRKKIRVCVCMHSHVRVGHLGTYKRLGLLKPAVQMVSLAAAVL